MADTTTDIARRDADERAFLMALQYARETGTAHGRAAASWYEIRDEATARAILSGLEDGDPAILDTLPSADLSGEWADTLTGPQLVADAWAEGLCSDYRAVGMDHTAAYEAAADRYIVLRDAGEDAFSELCDAFELAFSEAAEDAIARAARLMLED